MREKGLKADVCGRMIEKEERKQRERERDAARDNELVWWWLMRFVGSAGR